MNQRVIGLLMLAGLAYCVYTGKLGTRPKPPPCPGPNCPVPAPPAPTPPPPPKKPRRPWGDQAGPVGSPVEGGKVSPDGTVEIAIDLPASEKKRNTGGMGPRGPGSGAGLCVFTSIEYAARWQGERRLFDFQKKMTREPGGGYPEKVDAMLAKYGKGVTYVQDTSKDYELLKAAVRSGRMPCVTYNGHDVHYRGSIAHMVSLAHADDKWVCVTDNNYPGDNQFVWMSVEDFKQRWGEGWAVYLLNPPPPPIPRN